MSTSLTIEQNWERSDVFHNSFLIGKDDALERARANSSAAGLPEIAVSTAQGKLLNLVARSISAKRILEVGTLGGYSTIWLARAIPKIGGEIITCELDPKHAEVAKTNIAYAGFASNVKVLVGPAAETLAKMQPEQPFDLVFIDADKKNNLTYFLEAKRMTRKGGIIIVDNVVRRGTVADPQDTNEDNEGTRKLLRHIQNDPEVDATTIANVGEKGYDGFLFAIRL